MSNQSSSTSTAASGSNEASPLRRAASRHKLKTVEQATVVQVDVNGDGQKKESVRLMCLDLDERSAATQLLLCAGAVFLFYVLYGYLQELIFHSSGLRPFGWSLTLVQFVFYAIFALAEMQLAERRCAKIVHRIPLRIYAQLAFYTVGTMGLSNASVGYLNYPTQVIFKSCKLIPVMIGGILIQGKRYTLLDFVAVVLMTLGLVWFTSVDSQVAPVFDPRGYLLVSGALLFDAVIGNVQEKQIRRHAAANAEVVLFSYGIGTLYILVLVLCNGELLRAVPVFLENPLTTLCRVFCFSLTGYLGVGVVLTLVRRFGALVAVTVTTMRKAATIVLSFVLFEKAFSAQYVLAGLVVLAGIYLNVHAKNHHTLTDFWRKVVTCGRKRARPVEVI